MTNGSWCWGSELGRPQDWWRLKRTHPTAGRSLLAPTSNRHGSLQSPALSIFLREVENLNWKTSAQNWHKISQRYRQNEQNMIWFEGGFVCNFWATCSLKKFLPGISPLGLFLKTHNFSLFWDNIRQPESRDSVWHTWPVIFTMVKVMINKETQKNGQIGRDEGDMMTACHVGFWNVNGEMGEIWLMSGV